MKPDSDSDRSHESVINDTLARFLRERCGLSAAAETLHGGGRPDIIVRLPAGSVILETELEPALTVEADPLSRLGTEIDGLRVENVFAVTVPGRLRSASPLHLSSFAKCRAFAARRRWRRQLRRRSRPLQERSAGGGAQARPRPHPRPLRGCRATGGRWRTFRGEGGPAHRTEVIYTLLEIRVLAERYRQTYNRVRPHSSLGYRPPAPETVLPAVPLPVLAALT